MKRILDWSIRFILGSTCRLLCRMNHEGSHHVPKDGPFILACNHTTWIDSLLLIAACPRRVRFIITRPFHQKPLVYPVTHNTQSIPMDKKNPRAAIREAIEALQQGEAIAIYPEGGFTHDGTLREIQRGIEVLARGGKCPIVPVAISGLFGSALALRKEWRRDHIWQKPWPDVLIRFGEPIDWQNLTCEGLGHNLNALLTDQD